MPKKKPADEVTHLVCQMGPILHGYPPDVQETAITQLYTMFLVGWPDFLREDLLQEHMKHIQTMIPPLELIQHGKAGHPLNRKGKAHGNGTN
ncbi:MAG TPA: hypothetical protein VK602_19040 [Phyllobacterium sp.]|nr:hypothetical protein [Phyllobacterium sp.]